ncbi:MAG: hypothetical protein L0H93_18125 [Nocardioides sp.]|nr:hypothetical protein [Nocardioides sp.]
MAIDNPSAPQDTSVFQGTGTVRVLGTQSPGDVDNDGRGDQLTVWVKKKRTAWTRWASTTTDPESGRYASVKTVPATAGTYQFAVTRGSSKPARAKVKSIIATKTKVHRSYVRLKRIRSCAPRNRKVRIHGVAHPAVSQRAIRLTQRLGKRGAWRGIRGGRTTTTNRGTWSIRVKPSPRTRKTVFVRAWLWEPAVREWRRSQVRIFRWC